MKLIIRYTITEKLITLRIDDNVPYTKVGDLYVVNVADVDTQDPVVNLERSRLSTVGGYADEVFVKAKVGTRSFELHPDTGVWSFRTGGDMDNNGLRLDITAKEGTREARIDVALLKDLSCDLAKLPRPRPAQGAQDPLKGLPLGIPQIPVEPGRKPGETIVGGKLPQGSSVLPR